MNPPSFDTLSAPVQRLLAAARAAGAYEQLVLRSQQKQPQPQLQPQPQPQPQQPPQPPAPDALERLSVDDLFDARVTRPDEARCVLAGLWLYFDGLDRAHRVVQDVASASGSFWHAIVHRREGDFANSRYWYARCREHPALRAAGADVALGSALVDLVEEVVDLAGDDPRREQAVRAQRLEWDALLGHCARAAVGGGA